MARDRFTNAELKAGVFLTFCIGLLVAMLFVYGKVSRNWRGRQMVSAVFTSIANLGPEAQVLYNGLEVGKVRRVELVEIDEEALLSFPVMGEQHLVNLPLTDDERSELRGYGRDAIDVEIRRKILGRTMVRLALEVLAEGDAKRYRTDDLVRVTATIMGESAVEIISGTGAPLPEDQQQVLIGQSGDMYSDLAKSMDQVKNILTSVSEMVGGGADSPMAQKVRNFDGFTQRLDVLSDKLSHNLPEVWDSLDGQLEQVRVKFDQTRGSIANIRPELEKKLEGANAGIADLRKNVADVTVKGHEKIKELHGGALEDLKKAAELTREYKGRIPVMVKDTRSFLERISGRVENIERTMTRADRTLREGILSTRQLMQGLSETADGLEEKFWYLGHYPWAAIQPPRGPEGYVMDAEWRRDLMAWHYGILRGVLEEARREFKPQDASDTSRVERITRILGETDAFLLQEKAPAPAPKKALSRTAKGPHGAPSQLLRGRGQGGRLSRLLPRPLPGDADPLRQGLAFLARAPGP
ncbi:MAG: hypothetical protein M5U26_07495 [Planctomycetota bacterium]|nr:hypothetical protein [Planctomycetota bacterium]